MKTAQNDVRQISNSVYEICCKECNESCTSYKSAYALSKLGRHLKKHNMTQREYVIKHYLGNTPPLCNCGCGNETNINKWYVKKYFQDHKNKMPMSLDVKLKMINTIKSTVNYTSLGLTESDLEEAWNLYQTPKYPSSKISQKYQIDFRVIKKYWIKARIATQAQISRISKMHKGVWSNIGEKNGRYQKIADDYLEDIYSFLKECGKTVTFNYLKDTFGIKQSAAVLKKRLYEKYGEENIKRYTNLGNCSHAEVNFGFVLKYYFGTQNIKTQFKIQNKIFDYLIMDTLLVEFDGDYWHDTDEAKASDAIKNQIAINHGYDIFRVKYSERLNPNKIIEITKILENKNEIQA